VIFLYENRLMFAVRDYLQTNLPAHYLTKAEDTPNGIQYGPEHGRYFLELKNVQGCGYIYFIYENNSVTLRILPYKTGVITGVQAVIGQASSRKPELNNFLRDILGKMFIFPFVFKLILN
jgi:hypothetical protein